MIKRMQLMFEALLEKPKRFCRVTHIDSSEEDDGKEDKRTVTLEVKVRQPEYAQSGYQI